MAGANAPKTKIITIPMAPIFPTSLFCIFFTPPSDTAYFFYLHEIMSTRNDPSLFFHV